MRDFIDAVKAFLKGLILAFGYAIFIPLFYEMYEDRVEKFGSSDVVAFIFLAIVAYLTAKAIDGSVKAFSWCRRVFLGQRSDIVCTWCGGKSMRYCHGSEGDWFWEYRNADGSRDKRVSGNFQQASFTSHWECKQCGAMSRCVHFVTERPSRRVGVWKGQLLEPGVGERIAEDYEVKTGHFVNKNSANRKNS